MQREQLLKAIEDKYDINTYTILKGLLHGGPITYRQYIKTNLLLCPQNQRTDLLDEIHHYNHTVNVS